MYSPPPLDLPSALGPRINEITERRNSLQSSKKFFSACLSRLSPTIISNYIVE